MATQSEAALENGLIKTLMDNSYERVFIKEEENLKANFKVQLETYLGRISQPTQMVSERISGIESNNDRGTKKMPL